MLIYDEFNSTMEMVNSMISVLGRQHEEGTLEQEQAVLERKLLTLRRVLYELQVTASGEEISMKEWLKKDDISSDSHIKVSDPSDLKKVSEEIDQMLSPILEQPEDLTPETIKQKLKVFFTFKLFATFNQLRTELLMQYNGERISIAAEDGTTIDCVFLPGLYNGQRI